MKIRLFLPIAVVSCLAFVSAHAQFGGPGGMGPRGPELSGSTAKLFEHNPAFTAILDMQSRSPGAAEPLGITGKIAFDNGKSRFEVNMGDMKGAKMSAQTAAQMKSMGMDKTVVIARPDRKTTYLIYPGLHAYFENPMREQTEAASDLKASSSETGKETVDGRSCVKNKTVVTDKEGKSQEFVVWNATDLKSFPIKIEQENSGGSTLLKFKDVKLAKPDAALFEPPSDCQKYDSMQAMMHATMMKRAPGNPGAPGKPAKAPAGGNTAE